VQQPLPDLSRASLLTSLGWYVNNITHDLKGVVSLGEQAAALTQGTERVEALTERAFAQSLIAQGAQIMDPVRATNTATSALSLFAQVTEASPTLDDEALYDIHLQAACLECLLGHTEEAAKRCRQAFELAANRGQRGVCLTELGTIYREANRLAEAREAFVEAIKAGAVAPGAMVRPYSELGLVERALGKLPEARAKQQRALGILQDNPSLQVLTHQQSRVRSLRSHMNSAILAVLQRLIVRWLIFTL
jgi:tetratricopeptide (TPR) repeat protein